MAIILNAGHGVSKRYNRRGGARATVVPAASVWEPKAQIVKNPSVRTLSAIDRTDKAAEIGQNLSNIHIVDRAATRERSAVLSNLVLGGIFGLSVLLGTAVFGVGAAEQSAPLESFSANGAASSSVLAK
ncbi:MAG: hypothetical protein SOW59_01445 [Corynebacterium sp.]|nr:hypothetical protein [Corynebacterium sp.]